MTQTTYVPEYATLPTYAPVRLRWMVIVQAIQLLVVMGVTSWVWWGLSDSSHDFWGPFFLGVGECIAVCLLQWLFLIPIVQPRIDRGCRKPWTYWLAASVAGLFIGLMIAFAVTMVGDVLWWLDVLPSEGSGRRMTEEVGWGVAIVGALVLLASWAVMTPLLVVFMKNRSAERSLLRIASAIFVGTVVEAISSVGIMVMMNKKSDCVCATFSGLTLVVTFAIGFVIFGPAVLLLVMWRRSRQRPGGLCPVCGFDLNPLGYPERCPSCGAGWKAPSPPSALKPVC